MRVKIILLTLMVLGIVGCATTPTTPYQCAETTGSQEELTKCYNSLPDDVKLLKKLEAKKKPNDSLKNQEDAYANIAVAKAKLAKLSDEERKKISADIRNERLIYEKNNKSLDFNNQTDRSERIKKEKEREAIKKQKILADLKQRCDEYGFTGESNISACIQREAQHDKELAVQKYELEKTRLALQQAQSRTYVQNVTEPVQKEEDLPFLIKFLGDVAIGVADAYADPAFQRDLKLQQQINNLNRQRLLDSINN